MKHFTPSWKMHIVRCHLEGKDVSEIMRAESISPEELASWCVRFEDMGVSGLKSTMAQVRRHIE